VVQVFCFTVQKTVAIMGDVGGAAAAGGGDAEPFLHGKRKRKGGIAWTPWPGHAGFRAEVRYPNDYPHLIIHTYPTSPPCLPFPFHFY